MENLFIKGEEDIFFIPEVRFDAVTGICTISGQSYLDDAAAFYKPLLDWLRLYMKEVNNLIFFIFKIKYYTTTSSRSIVEILFLLKEYKDKGGSVTINWYLEDDEELEEDVQDFSELAEIEIKIIRN
ncbi:MAG: DUF1987 domain-containing protein [Bacteroidia bacterium]|nr:DUF1987 domain-containing protein [Bacteroidia bacterium]